jgi:hypothetical protein
MAIGTAIFVIGLIWLLIVYPGFRRIVFWLALAGVLLLGFAVYNNEQSKCLPHFEGYHEPPGSFCSYWPASWLGPARR